MTFDSAINSLAIGGAAKLPTMKGYVKKVAQAGATAPAWSGLAAYHIGDFVTQYSRVYVCVEDIPAPASTGISNIWEPDKWLATELNHEIVFQESKEPESGIGHDGVTTYVFSRSQAVEGSGAEATIKWTTTAPTEKPLAIDAELFDAFCSDEWTMGSAEDFEKVRTGSGRW